MQRTFSKKIGHYQLLRSLGKGGMGEVFLSFDTQCKRYVALKIIREDLKEHAIIKERFLREAHVAAQLTHPAIIPIFSIESYESQIFYIMPFVEGETLKEILKISYTEEKEGEVKHPIGSSIIALTRIFLSVCEAIAYTHSKGIVHRDLKPDNIIVGKYGEVMLLDWGIADFIGAEEKPIQENDSLSTPYKDLTHPGKVPGTLNYLAPERAQGNPSEATMDIYSLGVILYQLLTLRVPFRRSTLKSFKKTMHLEKVTELIEMAPHRDIPQHLADIAKRCLEFSVEKRFQTVDQLIEELKNFLEGKPEWIPTAVLKVEIPNDWKFQENILLSKHLAITRSADIMEWVSLMISRASFTGNIKLEVDFILGSDTHGIGFLLAVPDLLEKKNLNDGYCLWLSEDSYLYYNNMEVMKLQGACILKNTPYHVAIEKTDRHLNIFLNHQLICRYISHIPASGTHIGVLCKDADFQLKPIKISVGSQNALVNCLAIPDAFLADKNYSKALIEYRKIANSFAGRSEGREAIFRAGVTLLEEASLKKQKKEKQLRYLLALEEFGRLRFTPGAPLEYLGKSLVYKATKEIEEEIKCLELALRKYPKHPLISSIKEQILFRLHECASKDRVAAYHFALLTLRYLPQTFSNSDYQLLISSLKKHLENLPFLLFDSSSENDFLACVLSFWIPKPITLIEIIEISENQNLITNAFYALLALGFEKWIEENLTSLKKNLEVEIALLLFQKTPKEALEKFFNHYSAPFTKEQLRCLCFLFDQALLHNRSSEILPFFQHLSDWHSIEIDALHLQALLLENNWENAQQLLSKYSSELTDEYSPLYSLMGCFLRHTQGKEIALSHFQGSIELPYPPTSFLLSDFLKKKINLKKGWICQAFAWEKIQLYRQLILYSHCANQFQLKNFYLKKLKKELKDVRKKYSYP